MKRKSKKSVPNANCKIRGGVLHVLVAWDDKTRGDSHYVPVHCLKSDAPLQGGANVSMRHSRKVWTGRIQLSERRMAALSLIHGKNRHVIVSCVLGTILERILYLRTRTKMKDRSTGHVYPMC